LNYQIKPGDTLTSIAKQNGVTVGVLLKGNPKIKNPDLIFAGNQLNIPDNTPKDAGTESPYDSIVIACPLAKATEQKKVDLKDADDGEIIEALKKGCPGISDITQTSPGKIKNTVVPSKQNALVKIEVCMSKYSFDREGEQEAKKILEHWARNELNEMPIYQGNISDFAKDMSDADYIVMQYPESEAVYHSHHAKNPTKWKVKDESTGKWTGWEYVFDGDGVVVKNIEDAGTFNYTEGSDSSSEHKENDVDPYFIYGSGPKDSTTKANRYLKTVDALGPKAKEIGEQVNESRKRAKDAIMDLFD
jgi:LysM repeat protein